MDPAAAAVPAALVAKGPLPQAVQVDLDIQAVSRARRPTTPAAAAADPIMVPQVARVVQVSVATAASKAPSRGPQRPIQAAAVVVVEDPLLLLPAPPAS